MSNQDILRAKDQIIVQLNDRYEKLSNEHKKSQELINATTSEVKRLTQELKEYRNRENSELIFNEANTTLGTALVSDHIKANESFSSMPYCDSDGKYRNGYGTLAVMVKYKAGQTVKLRNCKGKVVTVTAKEGEVLPEAKISEEEALSRKEAHLIKHVFPYLYGKHFRSPEEFIVATDVIYNRGIAQSKSLFNSDGTINCKSLYNYMDHSKQAYQQVMRKRYAKNYALCIQS
jgi:GH24 family phage-related lysozyme (muramidase)